VEVFQLPVHHLHHQVRLVHGLDLHSERQYFSTSTLECYTCTYQVQKIVAFLHILTMAILFLWGKIFDLV
jgi:hypothetical protein